MKITNQKIILHKDNFNIINNIMKLARNRSYFK